MYVLCLSWNNTTLYSIAYSKTMGIIMVLCSDRGTVVLMVLSVITRVPNSVTGGIALSINEMDIITMTLEVTHIGICALIVTRENTEQINQRTKVETIINNVKPFCETYFKVLAQNKL